MTDPAAPRWTVSRWMLWPAFLLVHLLLCFVNLVDQYPLGDVTLVYQPWMQQGFDSHLWVGIDVPWVYPILAIVPMLLAWSFGPDGYAVTWLALVTALDAVAFGFLIGWTRGVRNIAAAWWWLGFLVLLGPVALARIDTVTVPLAIVGVLFAASRPRAAGTILAIAAWMKVWPGAILVALVIATKARWRILVAALLSSLVIVAVALTLGSGANVVSFLAQQTSRGLQIEAPVSTLWLWQAFAGAQHAFVYYDIGLLTFQVGGDEVDAVSALMTPLMLLAVLAIALLALLTVRGGASATELLPPLALALVTAFIAFNKVGSPQYLSWLAVPVILGMATAGAGQGRSFRTPAGVVAVLAVLTQLIYPYLYDELLMLDPVPLILLTVRNLLLFVLLGWAVAAVWGAGRHMPRGRRAERPHALPADGPFATASHQAPGPIGIGGSGSGMPRSVKGLMKNRKRSKGEG